MAQALSAVGQEFETRELPNWERGEILKLTNGSYYQVPVIQFEDRIVYESGTDTLDVARFVDEEFGQNKLFPKKFEGLQQIIVPYIENDVEGTTSGATPLLWGTVRFYKRGVRSVHKTERLSTILGSAATGNLESSRSPRARV